MKILIGIFLYALTMLMCLGGLWLLDNAIRSDAKMIESRYNAMHDLLGKSVVLGKDTLVVIDIFPDERKYKLSDKYWYGSDLVEKLTIVNATP